MASDGGLLAARSSTGVPVLARLRALLPSLSPSDRRAAETILADPSAVVYASITEVADNAGTSPSTVFRCAQQLGFKGFHDLKLALAQELALLGDPSGSAPDASGSPAAILNDVLEAGAHSLADCRATIDQAAFAAAVDALSTADRMLFVGVGTSAPLAQDVAYRFKAVGADAEACADVHVQHLAARRLRPRDVCLAVSHTGSTRETNACVEAAKLGGATTIAVTSFSRSPLTDIADIVLIAGSRELSFQLEAMASRLAHLATLDALLVGFAHAHPGRSRRALELYTSMLAEHRM